MCVEMRGLPRIHSYRSSPYIYIYTPGVRDVMVTSRSVCQASRRRSMSMDDHDGRAIILMVQSSPAERRVAMTGNCSEPFRSSLKGGKVGANED